MGVLLRVLHADFRFRWGGGARVERLGGATIHVQGDARAAPVPRDGLLPDEGRTRGGAGDWWSREYRTLALVL